MSMMSHFRLATQSAHVKDKVHVGTGQAVIGWLQFGNAWHAAQMNGIHGGAQMAEQAVGVDHAQDGRLFAGHFQAVQPLHGIGLAGAGGLVVAKIFTNILLRRFGLVARAIAQAFKIRAPAFLDR
jgi:hypothetical protein